MTCEGLTGLPPGNIVFTKREDAPDVEGFIFCHNKPTWCTKLWVGLAKLIYIFSSKTSVASLSFGTK